MTFEEFDKNLGECYINVWRADGFIPYYNRQPLDKKKQFFEKTFIWSFYYDLNDKKHIKFNYLPMANSSLEEVKDLYYINIAIWKEYKIQLKLENLEKDFTND